MSEQKRERGKPSLWPSIQTAIWLIGLAILAWQGWWWPGILVLLAISGIVQALIARFTPDASEEAAPPSADTPESIAEPVSIPASAPAQEHRLELLPSECPKCSGPIRGHELRWTGPQSADCPYCGANLPIAK